MKKQVLFITMLFFCLSFYCQTNTWNGNADTDWHKSCNWSLNVIPTVTHDVIIPTVTNYPVITGNAHCQSLSITSTASPALTINSSGGAELCISSTNGGACITSLTDNSGPSASNTTSTAAICENQTKSLVGTPGGGSWTIVSGGGSISGSTYTPPNVGSNTPVTVRYSVSCPPSTSDRTFTVNVLQTASNTTSTAAICENQTKSLTGTPGGGSWTVVSGGGSISGSTYTPPNVASNTPVTVRYTIPANGGCPSSTSNRTFTVNVLQTANNTTSTAAINDNQTKSLTGSPAGGSWSLVSGSGSISGSTFTPSGPGSVTVRYTIAANGGCPASTSDRTFTVNASASAVTATDTYGMMAFGTWTGSGVKGAGAVFVIYNDGTWGFNTGGTWSGPPDGTYTGTWLSGAPTTPVNLEWRLTEYNSTSAPFNSPGSSWTSPVSTTPWGTTNVSANIATACGSGGGITRYLGCKVEFRNSVTLVVVATHYFSGEIGC